MSDDRVLPVVITGSGITFVATSLPPTSNWYVHVQSLNGKELARMGWWTCDRLEVINRIEQMLKWNMGLKG